MYVCIHIQICESKCGGGRQVVETTWMNHDNTNRCVVCSLSVKLTTLLFILEHGSSKLSQGSISPIFFFVNKCMYVCIYVCIPIYIQICECKCGRQVFVYHESIKRELKIRCICECRCDERLQTKTKKFTRLTYTGLVVELEHLKIETTFIDEKFANAMGEYVT
jgi:hypothetical protein